VKGDAKKHSNWPTVLNLRFSEVATSQDFSIRKTELLGKDVACLRIFFALLDGCTFFLSRLAGKGEKYP